MEINYVLPEFKTDEKPTNLIYISYSQFSSYMKCPNYWKLCYIDKIKKKESIIHTIFGTAMHTVIQEWIKIVYLETVKKSDQYDFAQRLKEELRSEYLKGFQQSNVHYSSVEEMKDFYTDGLNTLEYLRKHRTKYFDRKNEELIGVELPLFVVEKGICLISYLDLVFRNKFTKEIIIKDLKTSTKGWSKWEKEDEIKISQLILYKLYFAKQYNVPVDNISVEYIILKRKVMNDTAYPNPRVSTFKPTSGKITQNKVNKMFNSFIDNAFTDGKYNTTREYLAVTGNNNYNCRFCEFADDEDKCPKSKRLNEAK
jgi:hypothetical protein